MRLALIAMPWNRLASPSPALGVLAAAIRQERPDYEVVCKFPYITVAELIGNEVYSLIGGQRLFGDIIYAGHLYPEKRESVRAWFARKMEELAGKSGTTSIGSPTDATSYEDLYDRVFEATEAHLEGLATELVGKYNVIGFTTTYIQLFASLAASKKIKELDTSVVVVLGGAGIAFGAAESILREYPYVDYILEGDGEWRFLDFLEDIETGNVSRGAGTASNSLPSANLVNMTHDLNKLPLPDYDEYSELAEENGSIYWYIPIEGSRGCWWDRVHRTGNPLDACCFCNLSGSVYREKSVARVAWEMKMLSERYSNLKFRFTDCVMRRRGIGELAEAIKNLDRKFDFFYEIRASVNPYELMLLWEAGCKEVQIGIEGLSSSYLQRIGKGTTTIQNLQAMKTCFELGILSISNLLTDFPGSTQAEVEETVHNILDYAAVYQPLNRSIFRLERNNCVYKLPEQFAISYIRNAEEYRAGLPEDAWQRLQLYALDYDSLGEVADWNTIDAALEHWRALHRSIREDIDRREYFILAPLYYEDRDTYLEIIDRRTDFRIIELDGKWRDTYLYCMEVRDVRDVVGHLSERYGEEEIKEILDAFIREKLMFVEKDKCLSLAVAAFPHIAAERIRKAH